MGEEWITLKAGQEFLETCFKELDVHAHATLRSNYFRMTNCRLIGDIPVRGRKANRKWQVNASDLTAVVERLTRLRVAGEDCVLCYPVPRTKAKRTSRRAERSTWRQNTHHHLLQRDRSRGNKFPLLVFGINILPHVQRTEGSFSLPAPLVELFDNAEAVERLLLRDSASCACGTTVPEDSLYLLREDGPEGWAARCEQCRSHEIGGREAYTAGLYGTVYGSQAMRAVSPKQFLCSLCGGAAKIWDHCHDHSFVRGPLCESCNQTETHIFANCWNKVLHLGGLGGIPRELTWQQVVDYLQTCRQCAELRTIPAHQWAFLAHEGLWGTPDRDGPRAWTLGRCPEWTEPDPCEMFRTRNHQAANALVPLFWTRPAEPNPDWLCRTHRQRARPYNITREQARAAAMQRLEVLGVTSVSPPW